jgi:hypothetical protein
MVRYPYPGTSSSTRVLNLVDLRALYPGYQVPVHSCYHGTKFSTKGSLGFFEYAGFMLVPIARSDFTRHGCLTPPYFEVISIASTIAEFS